MASMDIDKPLDELIASKPRGRRGGGRGPRGAGGRAEGGAAPAAGGARARYAGAAPKTGNQQARGAAAAPAKAGKPLTAEATKIIISNLPTDVTEAAVRDLLQSTVGPVRSVLMSYNSSGKSNGVATILFKNKGDANKAHATYNNRMIDNQKAMRVEIAIDPNALQSLASRVAPAAAPAGNARKTTGPGRRSAPRKPAAPRQTKKTAEELDAEMAAYKAPGAA